LDNRHRWGLRARPWDALISNFISAPVANVFHAQGYFSNTPWIIYLPVAIEIYSFFCLIDANVPREFDCIIKTLSLSGENNHVVSDLIFR
jgi:hypothetical protein